MKLTLTTISVFILLALTYAPAPVISRTTPHPLVQTVTLTGQVVTGLLTGDRITFTLGGNWQRRFIAVIYSTDLHKFPPGTERAYTGKTVRISGPIVPMRGQYEIQLSEPSQIVEVTEDGTPVLAPPANSAPIDMQHLQDELMQLKRQVATLKQNSPTPTPVPTAPLDVKPLQQEIRSLRGQVDQLNKRVDELEGMLHASYRMHHP